MLATLLLCDMARCPEPGRAAHGYAGPTPASIEDVRREAAEHGWGQLPSSKGPLDLCPKCMAKLARVL